MSRLRSHPTPDLVSLADGSAGSRMRRPRRLSSGVVVAVLGASLCAAVSPDVAADVLHVYDRLHRLRATVDSAANDAAIWTYDPVGNVLSITRQPATQTTILELPADAVVGACGVRILGIGFSATPAQNTVTVNGVAATVQGATATELVVCVGAGTTTGLVAVTTPTGSATSAAPLTVLPTGAGPTITSLTPGVAVWGTALSVTGTHFDPGPGRTRLRMGGSRLLAPVTSVTATTLGTTVGPGTTSGRVTVTTPAGTATAAADLFVPPAPYVASDVAITGRWSVGATQAITLPPLKQALFVFDGAAGQRVCVETLFTTGSGFLVKGVFLPSGSAMFPPYSGGSPVIELGALPVEGTYQIQLLNSDSGAAAVGTVTLRDASDQVQGSIPTDGTATALSFGTPCYRAGRTFTGTVGQRVSLTIGSTVHGSVAVTLVGPSGSTVLSTTVPTMSAAFVEPVTLSETGTYTWWGDPIAESTGTLTLRLYDVVDVETPITPGGAPVTATLTVPAQKAALPFSGTAGQRASIQLDQIAMSAGSSWVAQPDGSVLGPVQGFSGGQVRYFEVPTFPATGTYRVMVDPVADYTGSVRVTLWTYADVTAVLTPGMATPVSLAAPGQRAVLTFGGTAGQRVNIQTTAGSGTLGSTMATSVLKPDGTVLVSGTLALPGLLGGLTLPVDGTYSVVFDPWGSETGSFAVTLSDALTLTWTGQIRDRVGGGELALAPDGALDGTVTVTLTGPARTVQQLVLRATGGIDGFWDTIPSNGYWVMGAAATLDAALLNAADGSVFFGVTSGGSFVVFASDWQGREFLSGQTLTLTATFSDGTTAAAAVTIP